MRYLRYIFSELRIYICNYVIAKFPSRRIRLAFYRYIMKFKIDRDSSIFMGAFVTSSGNFTMSCQSVINPKCHLDTRGGIEIGKNVSISGEVVILTGDHDIQDPKFKARFRSVKIEDNVFIGFRATILPDVIIGRGSVICAGSVVTKDVPPLTIVAGVPAKKIGNRNGIFDRNMKYSRLFG